MAALLDVILPVFLILGAGYAAAWTGIFSQSAADGLMDFTQKFAIPCLLFRAIAEIDLQANLDAGLLSSFYLGVSGAFALGALGAKYIFGRAPEDCIAIGFSAFFSNSVLLGLPIMERAYGTASLAPNYAIIAFHAPLLYTIGIIAMEIVKHRGQSVNLAILGNIARSILTNALVIGILLGFAVNIGGLTLPSTVDAATQMLARAGLPAALFALGAILFRYRPEGDLRVITWVALISLVIHPAITWSLASHVFALSTGQIRAAVVTAAMAPGVNTYVFANMFNAAKRVAASSVLICTGLSLLSAWAWISLLP